MDCHLRLKVKLTKLEMWGMKSFSSEAMGKGFAVMPTTGASSGAGRL